MLRVLWLLLCLSGTLPGCVGSEPGVAGSSQDLCGPLPERLEPAPIPRLGPVLRLLAAARQASDPLLQHRIVAERGLALRQDHVLVELQLQRMDRLAPLLERHGARLRVRGTDRADVWVPLRALAALAAEPAVRAVRQPPRPRASLGNVVTQGLDLVGGQAATCAGTTGKDVHVAALDLSFKGLSSSSAEIGTLDGPVPTGGNAHGTACAEILFDMAPGIVVHPIQVTSLADLQAFVAGLSSSKVQVISDSLVWTGESFSDGTGPHCALVDEAAKAGVAWITSAGNHGNGTFYSGTFNDPDGDGRHEFVAGDEINEVHLDAGWQMAVVLDWDDYPQTDQDYDLLLSQKQSSGWTVVHSSTLVQDGSAPPTESLSFKATETGTYGLTIVRKQASQSGMRLRLFVFPAPGLKLEHWQADSSLEDPAHCKGVIAVGAVDHSKYQSGELWSASSRGPTTDGRVKPDIVAPSGVTTKALGTFNGTSAAAPHVAGALALYMEGTGKDALAAAQLLLQDALPVGTTVPNNKFGYGELMLGKSSVGWQCEPESSGPCPTSCGSTGTGTCGATCTWDSCTPPEEVCNGKDDDCDGEVDEQCKTPSPDGGSSGTDGPRGEDGCSMGRHGGPAGLLLLALAALLLVRRRFRSRRPPPPPAP